MLKSGLAREDRAAETGIEKGNAMIDSENWPEFRFACNGGGGCIVVKRFPKAGAIVICDSKNPNQPGLVFSNREYAAFRRRVVDSSWRRAWPRLTNSLLRLTAAVLRLTMASRH